MSTTITTKKDRRNVPLQKYCLDETLKLGESFALRFGLVPIMPSGACRESSGGQVASEVPGGEAYHSTDPAI